MLREYFIGVLGLALLLSILLSLSHPRLTAVTRFGAGVLLFSAVLLPLVDIIDDFDIDSALDGIAGGIDYEVGDSAIEMAFEDGVAEYIAKKYGVDRECVGVNADGFDISTLTADRIYVTLSGKGLLLDYKMIEAEVVSEFTRGGDCEVSFGIG